MCGIFGIIRFDNQSIDPFLFDKMKASIAHRGPDDYGQYLLGQVGLANLRLSIIDLKTGQQPIFNEDGKVVIVYNGEIYNFKTLRNQLKNHRFITQSDTEVILHGYEEWGLGCLPKLNGMFATAIWDGHKNELLLARDRMGIKPLYYIKTQHFFAFASEIKALHSAELFSPGVNTTALSSYLALKYVPSANTLFQGVRRLLPGEWMRISLSGSQVTGKFWEFQFNADGLSQSPSDLAMELRHLVQQSVHDHLVSDVPVGAFLSGGVDSGIVVSEMARQVGSGIKAFTIDYDSARNEQNEARYAEYTAKRAEVDHTKVICTSENALSLLPLLVYHLDEPISEPLLAPTFLLSQAARREVTVVLTGEGADELFAGYPRYKLSYFISKLQYIPPAIRKTAYQMAVRLLGQQDMRTRILRISLDSEAVYDWNIVYTSNEINSLTSGLSNGGEWASEWSDISSARSLLDFMLLGDTLCRLPEYILTRADKMTMANSLEMRPPLLDNRVVEFAMRLPNSMKLNGRQDKYILRKAFDGIIPSEVANRPKVAFSAPFENWLPGLSNVYLKDSHSAQAGLLSQEEVNHLLENNIKYRGRRFEKLWTLIVFEIWYRIYIDGSLNPF